MKVVGIIGAGASGLCAARHVLATSDLTPVVWEQSADVGGMWRLSEDVGVDKNGLPVHSSIYKGLICDIPKLLMAFPDFPFPEEGQDFVPHTVVIKYLEDYAKEHNLFPSIKFGHHVENVCPVLKGEDEPPAWEVTVKTLSDGTVTTTTCDALLVCNGHFSVPNMPVIEGIENFKGKVIHSHDYREPSPYAGRRVVVLGAGPSGLDICLELSTVAKEVYVSHNLPVLFPSEFPPNVHQVRGVKMATHNGFILGDGQCVSADVIIYCTGYKYSFPFLSEACKIRVENGQVNPLYKHIINAEYPSMGLIGIPSRILVFPVVNYQVRYFLATLTGKEILPTPAEMLSTVEASRNKLRLEGKKDSEYHKFHSIQWSYMEDLATCTQVEQPSPVLKTLLSNIILPRIFLSFTLFKTYSYKVNDDGAIIESRNGKILNTKWDLTVLIIQQLARLVWRDFFRICRLLGTMVWKRFSKPSKHNLTKEE